MSNLEFKRQHIDILPNCHKVPSQKKEKKAEILKTGQEAESDLSPWVQNRRTMAQINCEAFLVVYQRK